MEVMQFLGMELLLQAAAVEVLEVLERYLLIISQVLHQAELGCQVQ
jgi:hypothetical protein